MVGYVASYFCQYVGVLKSISFDQLYFTRRSVVEETGLCVQK